MPTPAISDQGALQQLFQESMSPLTAYNQGALQIALLNRQRQQKLADVAQEQQFQLQRDKSQSALVMAREQELQKIKERAEAERAAAADKRLMDKAKLEHDFKSEDAKEKDRVDQIKKANEIGANLPQNATYEDALAAFTKAHGQTLITLNKRAGEAIRDITQGTNINGKEFSQKIANAIADDEGLKKVLTPKEREDIRNNPDKIKEYRAAFAKNPKKYNAFTEANKNAVETVTAALEKEHASKPSVVGAAARLKTIYSDMEIERKRAGYRPEDEDAALRAYNEVVYPSQPAEGPKTGPVMPPLTQITPPVQPAAVQSGQFPGLIPMGLGAARSVGSAIGQAAQPLIRAGGAAAQDVGTLFAGGNWVDPFAAAATAATPPSPMTVARGGPAVPFPPTLDTAAVVPPSELARRKLMQQIQESNAYNALLFPQQTNPSLFQP